MSAVDITVDAAALDILFKSTDGPVAKDLARRAINVDRRAKQLAPVDTGRLHASIDWGLRRDDTGLFAVIGSDVEYAIFQELGTRFQAAHPYLRPALDEARD